MESPASRGFFVFVDWSIEFCSLRSQGSRIERIGNMQLAVSTGRILE